MFDKKPINFALNEPTLLKYLDPVLYAHNISIDLLLSGNYEKGYHSFSKELSMQIVNEWIKLHNKDPEHVFGL